MTNERNPDDERDELLELRDPFDEEAVSPDDYYNEDIDRDKYMDEQEELHEKDRNNTTDRGYLPPDSNEFYPDGTNKPNKLSKVQESMIPCWFDNFNESNLTIQCLRCRNTIVLPLDIAEWRDIVECPYCNRSFLG